MNLDQRIEPHSHIGHLGCCTGNLPVSEMLNKEGLHIGQGCFWVYKDARGAIQRYRHTINMWEHIHHNKSNLTIYIKDLPSYSRYREHHIGPMWDHFQCQYQGQNACLGCLCWWTQSSTCRVKSQSNSVNFHAPHHRGEHMIWNTETETLPCTSYLINMYREFNMKAK